MVTKGASASTRSTSRTRREPGARARVRVYWRKRSRNAASETPERMHAACTDRHGCAVSRTARYRPKIDHIFKPLLFNDLADTPPARPGTRVAIDGACEAPV